LGAGVAQRGWGPHAGVGRVSLRAVFVAAAGKVLFTGSPSRDARSLTVSRLRPPLAFQVQPTSRIIWAPSIRNAT